MGDLISVQCVLDRGGFHDPAGDCDALAFIGISQRGNPWHWLPCHERGQPALPSSRPQWEYQILEGRLHFTPSLLDTSDQFHTDFHWNVAYQELPPGKQAFDFFFEINPDVKP